MTSVDAGAAADHYEVARAQGCDVVVREEVESATQVEATDRTESSDRGGAAEITDVAAARQPDVA